MTPTTPTNKITNIHPGAHHALHYRPSRPSLHSSITCGFRNPGFRPAQCSDGRASQEAPLSLYITANGPFCRLDESIVDVVNRFGGKWNSSGRLGFENFHQIAVNGPVIDLHFAHNASFPVSAGVGEAVPVSADTETGAHLFNPQNQDVKA